MIYWTYMSSQGQGHFLTIARSHSVFKLKFFFLKTIELFETKYHVKDFGGTDMKIYTNGLDNMTMMTAMPIYG